MLINWLPIAGPATEPTELFFPDSDCLATEPTEFYLPDSDYLFLDFMVTAVGFLNLLPAWFIISGLGAIMDFWYFLRFCSFLRDASCSLFCVLSKNLFVGDSFASIGDWFATVSRIIMEDASLVLLWFTEDSLRRAFS